MPREVIIQVGPLRLAQGMAETLSFADCHANETEDDLDDPENYSDDGSYVPREDSDSDSKDEDFNEHEDHDDDDNDDDEGPDDNDGPPPGGNDDDSHSEYDSHDGSDHEDGDADERSDLSGPLLVTPDVEDDVTNQASSQHEQAISQSDDGDTHDQGVVEEQRVGDMSDLSSKNQGVTDIDPSLTSELRSDDVDGESDQEDLTKLHTFSEAEEDRGCAAAEDDTHQQQRMTPRPQDPAYKYVNHMFKGMDSEVMFTFLTGND